jgi:hypothetical protein
MTTNARVSPKSFKVGLLFGASGFSGSVSLAPRFTMDFSHCTRTSNSHSQLHTSPTLPPHTPSFLDESQSWLPQTSPFPSTPQARTSRCSSQLRPISAPRICRCIWRYVDVKYQITTQDRADLGIAIPLEDPSRRNQRHQHRQDLVRIYGCICQILEKSVYDILTMQ